MIQLLRIFKTIGVSVFRTLTLRPLSRVKCALTSIRSVPGMDKTVEGRLKCNLNTKTNLGIPVLNPKSSLLTLTKLPLRKIQATIIQESVAL